MRYVVGFLRNIDQHVEARVYFARECADFRAVLIDHVDFFEYPSFSGLAYHAIFAFGATLATPGICRPNSATNSSIPRIAAELSESAAIG